MKNLLLVVLLLVSTSVAAFEESQIYIDLHVTSWHNQENFYTEVPVYYRAHPMYHNEPKTQTIATPFNSNNGGIGIRGELEDWLDVGFGFYKNSFYKTSVYGGIEIHTSRKRFVSLGLTLMAVSGYMDTPTPTPVIVMPVINLGIPEIGMRVGYMPFGEVPFATMSFYVGF